jgi:hypothetical protein
MPKVAIVAALEREVSGLTKGCRRVEREYEGRKFVFFERDEMVVVCGGIGLGGASSGRSRDRVVPPRAGRVGGICRSAGYEPG